MIGPHRAPISRRGAGVLRAKAEKAKDPKGSFGNEKIVEDAPSLADDGNSPHLKYILETISYEFGLVTWATRL